jgi:aspartate kinase
VIVAKFGGSSLADAGQFRKVRDIVMSDSRRRIIVPSAPGKRFEEDEKVTDLLFRCHREHEQGLAFGQTFGLIRSRYLEIVRDLRFTLDLAIHLDDIEQAIGNGASQAYCASRGEYLSGLVLSEYLGFPFVDAADVVLFDENGVFDSEKTNSILSECFKELPAVVLPGFYGSDGKGAIYVFPRGGSDITGAIAAKAVKAELYENWTDVSGFLMADPRIVPNPRYIRHITYNEMYALSSAGAAVLHEDSVMPVSLAGIPTNIRNTNQPEHPGTMITSTAVQRSSFSIFAGIAGKKGFSIVVVEKEAGERAPGINASHVRRAAGQCGMSAQFLPSSEDTACLVVESGQYDPLQSVFEENVMQAESPCSFSVRKGIACIVMVGYGIIHNRSTVNRIFTALKGNGIAIEMLNQGSGELITWVGVDENSMEEAIRMLYQEFSN